MANRVPAGPVGLPVLGSSVAFMDDPLGFFERCAFDYGPFVRIDGLRGDLYVLTDPEGIRHVLSANDANYVKPSFGERGLDGLLGSGLLTSDGPLWQRQRGRIQPAFYRDKLVTYAETMVRDTNDLADTWRDGEQRDVHADMSNLTLRIIVETVLGAELHGMERAISDALLDVGGFFRSDNPEALLPEGVPTPRNVRYRRARGKLDRIVRDIVRQRERGGANGDDVLGVLLRLRESGEEITDEQIRDEVLTMLLAGHDTTALTLTYVWYLLSEHPEVERRFHEEVDSLGGISAESVAELEYTGRIVTEAMRLYPPAYVVYRESVADDEVLGYRLPAGSIVAMPQWVVHRHPKYWERPDEFDPDRWDGETTRPDFAYFPFGGGPRRCIGDRFATMEAKLVMAAIGSRFELDYRGDGPVEFVPMITLHPEPPVTMELRERWREGSSGTGRPDAT